MTRSIRSTITVALGGNAILRHGEAGTAEEQFATVRDTSKRLVSMIEDGNKLVITHGNGPQVGDILLKNELAKELVPPMPLDVCGAESQGMIGYMLQQTLEDELGAVGLKTPVVTVLTQVLIDADDSAFGRPAKPIGPFFSRREASTLSKDRKWRFANDSGRGYRRLVPSPIPRDILEKNTIGKLFRSGTLVIAAGGGGIPVVRQSDGNLRGVEAVLDKDRTAALLARMLRTEILLILTDVDGVYLNYGEKGSRKLSKLDINECQRYLKEGHFPPGSMGPKIESAVQFLKSGGERVVIGSLEQAEEALAGRSGTTITRVSGSQR